MSALTLCSYMTLGSSHTQTCVLSTPEIRTPHNQDTLIGVQSCPIYLQGDTTVIQCPCITCAGHGHSHGGGGHGHSHGGGSSHAHDNDFHNSIDSHSHSHGGSHSHATSGGGSKIMQGMDIVYRLLFSCV